MAKENTEKKIMDAAVKLFYKRGYSASSTSEIAKEAGIAEGTIFRYFKTKKDILNKVLIKLIENLSENLIIDRMDKFIEESKSLDTKDMLKLILEDRTKMIEDNWEIIRIVLTEMQFHEDIRKAFYKNVVCNINIVLDKVIESGIEKGSIRNINKYIIKQAIIGNFTSFIIRKKVMNIDDETNIDDVADVILNGIGELK